jgi:hypothetical protein
VHIRLPFSTEPAPRCPPPKRLSFAAMLREDEGEGVLLTELACTTPPNRTLRHNELRRAVHYTEQMFAKLN